MKQYVPMILLFALVIWIGPHLWHWLGRPIGGRRHGGGGHRGGRGRDY